MTWILVVSPPRERPMAWQTPFFSRPGAMLMGADDGGVDHHVFIIVISRQHLEDTFENVAFAPPPEAPVRVLPIAEALGKIAPGNAGAIAIQNRLDKAPVVDRRPAHVAFSARQKILDPTPLVIPQAITTHQSALQCADRL